MYANRSALAIGAAKITATLDVFAHADVVKTHHIVNAPPFLHIVGAVGQTHRLVAHILADIAPQDCGAAKATFELVGIFAVFIYRLKE